MSSRFPAWFVLAVAAALLTFSACDPTVGGASDTKAGAKPASKKASAPASSPTVDVLAAPSSGQAMLRAKTQLSAGKPKVALRLLRQAQEAGYDRPDLHYYEGQTHLAMNDLQKAKAAFTAFLAKVEKKDSKLAQEAQGKLTEIEEKLAAPAPK